MKYYKEKYASGASAKTTAERARKESGDIRAKGVKRTDNKMRNRNDAVPKGAKRSKSGSHRSDKKQNTAPKKLSLWGRLKSLIGRNK